MAKYQIPIILLTLLCNLFFTWDCQARTWYLKGDGTGDAPTLRAAVDSASAGDTILVGPGHYATGTDWGLSIYKNIHLISEMGPQNTWVAAITISEGCTVIYLTNLGSNSSLIGFTIIGGYPWMGLAGGIQIKNSSTLIQNNIIRHNASQGAGGILCTDGGSPIIRKNVIYGNRGGTGCGIRVLNSSAVIDSNTIAYNGIGYDGSISCGSGGAIYVNSTLPVTISNNIIAFNHATNGGGIYCSSYTENIVFECNLVYGNEPTNYDGELPDQTGLNGNISLDPQFCAVYPDSTVNFYLQSDSPCLPQNNPNGILCGLIGAWPKGCGPIGTEETPWGKIKDMYRK